MRHLSKVTLLLILFISGCLTNVSGRDSLSFNKAIHHIGTEIRPSFVIPTHGFYNGWNSSGKPIRNGGSFHLKYSFTFPSDSRQSKIFPSSYQGLGLSVNSFLAHDLIGTPVSIYIFQGAPITPIGQKLTLDYEWNFGISFGWKTGEDVNHENMVIGSKANAYINVGMFFTYHTDNDWKFSAGPEYSHFSNGDTRFPNGGANTVNFRLGSTRSFGQSGIRKNNSNIAGTRQRKLVCDITAFGAWRADRMVVDSKLYIINKAFPIGGVNINPLYNFTSTLSAGISLDLLYDRSANLIANVAKDSLTYDYPSWIEQFSGGLSVRGEICMPVFSVNVGLGHCLYHNGKDLRGLYGIFSLKTKVSDMLFIHIGYRLSSISYANNMMFGIGWRIS